MKTKVNLPLILNRKAEAGSSSALKNVNKVEESSKIMYYGYKVIF